MTSMGAIVTPADGGPARVTDGRGLAVGMVETLTGRACSVNNRGEMVRVRGATLAADSFAICEKDDTDAYAWTAITPVTPAVASSSAALVMIAEADPSAVTEISFNGCFDATYLRYVIEFRLTLSANAQLSMRLRAAGTDESGANTYYSSVSRTAIAISNVADGTTGRTQMVLLTAPGTTNAEASGGMVVGSPFATAKTIVRSDVTALTTTPAALREIGGSARNATTSYDGFTILVASGTMTGNVKVYGLQDSPGDPGPSGYTDEDARDAVGTALVGDTGLAVVVDDALNTITLDLDATLSALAGYNTNGILTQTSADTFAGRTLTGTATKITVTNGDGVAGNPTITIPNSVTLVTPTIAATDFANMNHTHLGGTTGGTLTVAAIPALDSDLATFTLPASTTISAFGATLVDDANAAASIATLGLDADLATFALPASTTISATGASLIDDASTAAMMTTLGLDADLQTFALPASTTISATGASLIDDASTAAMIATLGLDADLQTFALPASTTISAFGKTLVDDADEATARDTLGLIAGDAGDIWVEKAGDTMTGQLIVRATAAGANTAPIKHQSGTVNSTAEAGAEEYDGSNLFFTAHATPGRGDLVTEYTFPLNADAGSPIGAAIANFFGASSAINLAGSSRYELEAHLYFLKTTANTVTYTLTFSSAPTQFSGKYYQSPIAGIGTNNPITGAGARFAATAACVLPVTGILATGVNHSAEIHCVFDTNAATNVRVNITSTTGTTTPLRNSFYKVRRLSVTGNYVA